MNTTASRHPSRRALQSIRGPAKSLLQAVCIGPIAALVVVLLTSISCSAAVKIEAYRGEPFGVGRVTVDLPQDETTAPGGDDRFAVSDDQGRVVYPVLEQHHLGKLLRDFLGIELPG